MGILEKIDIICLILDTDSFIEKLSFNKRKKDS